MSKQSISVALLASLSLLLSSSVARADWLIDRSGALVQVNDNVLGEDDSTTRIELEDEDELDDDANDNEDDDSAQEIARESEKQRLERSRELLKKQIELRKKIQENNGHSTEFELKTENGKLKLKQEIRDASGRLIRKSETNIEDDSLHIEQEDGETVEINAVDNRVEILRHRIRAHSDLELQVSDKNEISVTLPNGNTKTIDIPDQALERLIANGVITPAEDASGSASYELTAGRNGEPVYLADGVVEKKFLGIPFLKLKFAQQLEVAAGDSDDGTTLSGDIVSSVSRETSPWRRFLESLTR